MRIKIGVDADLQIRLIQMQIGVDADLQIRLIQMQIGVDFRPPVIQRGRHANVNRLGNLKLVPPFFI